MKTQSVALLCLGMMMLCVMLTSCVTTKTNAQKEEIKPYPFDYCAVIRKPFGRDGAKFRRVHEGHEVLFCCKPCVNAFDTHPDPWMIAIHQYYENLANNPPAEAEKKKGWFGKKD